MEKPGILAVKISKHFLFTIQTHSLSVYDAHHLHLIQAIRRTKYLFLINRNLRFLVAILSAITLFIMIHLQLLQLFIHRKNEINLRYAPSMSSNL